jgi:hypothetical protein
VKKKKPYPSERQERFIVRLPDGMRSRIANAAKANNRSMNAEVVSRLEAFERSDLVMNEEVLQRLQRLEIAMNDLHRVLREGRVVAKGLK